MNKIHQEQIKIITDWFKNHKATLNNNHLQWKQPNSIVLAIDYHIIKDTLVVTGDLGHAIYRWWNRDLTYQALNNLSLDYFVSKCEASQYGLQPKEFNQLQFETDLEFQLKDDPELKDAWDNWENKQPTEENWFEFCQEHLIEEWPEIGQTTPLRIVSHWYGLKLATKQLFG